MRGGDEGWGMTGDDGMGDGDGGGGWGWGWGWRVGDEG